MTELAVVVKVGHDTCHHRYYSLTCVEFDLLQDRSGGRCELCGITAAETPRGVLCIDHDNRYGTRAVRGLLCDQCNSHMRFVDAGERPQNSDTIRYLKEAWFMQRDLYVQGYGPLDRRHADWHLWKRFSALAGPRKRDVLASFIRWFARDEGAKLPKRPESVS